MVHLRWLQVVWILAGCGVLDSASGLEGGKESADTNRPTQRDEIERGMRWGYSVLFLLNDKSVQRELALGEKQKLGIERLTDEYADAMQQALRGAGLGAAPADAPSREVIQALARTRAELLSRQSKSAIELLTETQRKRLDQVAFQLCGVDALNYQEAMDALRLTDAQKAELKAITACRGAEWRKAMEAQGGRRLDAKELQKKNDEFLATARKRVLACLTPEQRKSFDSMEGSPIPFRRHDLDLKIGKKDASNGNAKSRGGENVKE